MKRISQNRMIFLLILLLAAGLRWYGITSQPLSQTEQLHVGLSDQPLTDIIRAKDGLPPLYPVLLKLWRVVFLGPFAIRGLSLAIGLLSIIAIRRITEEAANKKAAVFAMALAAISPFHLYLSQEGSHYGLVLLLGILAIQYGLRHLRGPDSQFSRRSDSAVFVLVAAAGLYSDYFISLLLIAIGVGAVLTRKLAWLARHQLYALKMATALYLLVAPLLLLIPGDVAQQHLSDSTAAKLPAVVQTLFSFESGYGLGPTIVEQQTMSSDEVLLASIPWLVLILSIVSCLLLLGIAASSPSGELQYWSCLIGLPILMLLTGCQFVDFPFDERAIAFCWAPYCIAIAIGFTVLLPKPRIVIGGLMIGIYALAFFNRHHVEAYHHPGATVAITAIESDHSSVE